LSFYFFGKKLKKECTDCEAGFSTTFPFSGSALFPIIWVGAIGTLKRDGTACFRASPIISLNLFTVESLAWMMTADSPY